MHIAPNFALYQISAKGSFVTDYYQLPDRKVIIFDRRTRIAFWESIPAPKAYNEQGILDSPLGHAIINSPFGKIRGGTDYIATGGTPYDATAKGKVKRAGFSVSFGNVVILDHGPGYNGSACVYTVYAHASKLLVHVGQEIKTGDVVSLVGNTGHVLPPPPRGYHGHMK